MSKRCSHREGLPPTFQAARDGRTSQPARRSRRTRRFIGMFIAGTSTANPGLRAFPLGTSARRRQAGIGAGDIVSLQCLAGIPQKLSDGPSFTSDGRMSVIAIVCIPLRASSRASRVSPTSQNRKSREAISSAHHHPTSMFNLPRARQTGLALQAIPGYRY